MINEYLGVLSLRLVSLVLAAGFIAMVTMTLSPEFFGEYSLILSIIQVLTAIALSWPNLAFLRFAREEFSEKQTIQKTLHARISIYVVLLFLTVFIVWIFGPILGQWTETSPDILMPFILLGVIVISINDMGIVAAQAAGRFSGYGMAPLILRAIQLATILIMFLYFNSSWQFLMAGTLIGYGLGAVFTWSKVPFGNYKEAMEVALRIRKILSYSWSLPLATLSAFLISWMDLWFLRVMTDLKSVGIYAWAYQVSLLASTLLVPLAAVMAPRMIDFRVESNSLGIEKTVRRSGAMVALCSSLMPLGLLGIALLSLSVDLGDYSASIPPLLILAVGTLFQMGLALSEPVVFAHESLVSKAVAIMIFMALINAIGNWLLIPIMGLNGPALATALSYAIGMALQWTMLKRNFDLKELINPTYFVVFITISVFAALFLGQEVSAYTVFASFFVSGSMFFIARRTALFSGLTELSDRFLPKTGRVMRKINPVVSFLEGRGSS